MIRILVTGAFRAFVNESIVGDVLQHGPKMQEQSKSLIGFPRIEIIYGEYQTQNSQYIENKGYWCFNKREINSKSRNLI